MAQLRVDEINVITGKITNACLKVHKALGPGLLESVYEACLAHELRKIGLQVSTQVPMPVIYEGLKLEAAYRIDMLVEEEVVVELKAVEKMHPIYEAQLLTYLKLSRKRVGLLINFNVPLIKDGITRLVNGL